MTIVSEVPASDVPGMSPDSGNMALYRLLQIASPSLPTGAFSYSQGLEWAVEAGWVNDESSFTQWILEQLEGTMARQELPLLHRLYESYLQRDYVKASSLCSTVIAYRETDELRHEERQRGRAMLALTSQLNSEITEADKTVAGVDTPEICQLGTFAQYCAFENVSLNQTMQGYTYAWLESQVMAAVKLVPLGQSVGQKILYALSAHIGACIAVARSIDETEIGYSNPAQLFASVQHETQYCRLFRS